MTTDPLNTLPEKLLAWYGRARREMPWRGEHVPPYHTWVSEIMLQQTRVEAVTPYFYRFVEALPTIPDLAEADEDLLHKLWQGLGYYNRVKNMRRAAAVLVEKYGGELPADFEALLSLPGIGEYTAGAIASIAFGLPVPAVDGNVLRVLTRVRADGSDVARPETVRAYRALAQGLIPTGRAGDFNQALMELGALVCLPNGAPRCGECPLRDLCAAHLAGREEEFPVKAPKAERTAEEKTVFLLRCGGELYLQRRPEKGLLAGLWEPLWTQGLLSREAAREYLMELGAQPQKLLSLGRAKHIFTHREWHMAGWLAALEERPALPGAWADLKALRETFAVPNAYKKYMEAYYALTEL